MDIYFNLAVTVICLCLSAFFSSSETALFALKKATLHRFSESSAKSAERRIYNMMSEPDKILITILIGNLFVNIIFTSISTRLFLIVWPEYGHIISTVVATTVIVLLCEISPKIIAYSAAESIAKRNNRLLSFFHAWFLPVRGFLLIFSNFVIRGFKLSVAQSNITSDELEQAVQIGEAEGVINKDERVFIQNVLLFSEKDASNVMFPRNTAVFLNENDTVKTAAKVLLQNDIVRAPVFRDDYDHIIGYVDSKDIMLEFLGYRKETKIKKFIQPIKFYPSTKELHELLNDFISTGSQIAVLLDEYGGVDGVVTLDRVLAELMGQSKAATGAASVETGDFGQGIISGGMQTGDFNFKFGDEIESDASDSVGGYITEVLGHIPKKGEFIETGFHVLKVKEVKGNTVISVSVKKKPAGKQRRVKA